VTAVEVEAATCTRGRVAQHLAAVPGMDLAVPRHPGLRWGAEFSTAHLSHRQRVWGARGGALTNQGLGAAFQSPKVCVCI